MENKKSFYLASNSRNGFYSLFDESQKYNITRKYIIKGGPGTGKSSFMKKVSEYLEEKGYDVEKIYCSSDPESLDGIISIKANIEIVDGTAPHVVEPKIVGAVDNYLSFSQFWDSEKLLENKDEINNILINISKSYKSAYKYIACLGILKDEILLNLNINLERLMKRAGNLAKTNFTRKNTETTIHKRFINAISYKGDSFLAENLKADKLYYLQDSFGISDFALKLILEKAKAHTETVYVCYSPLDPQRIEHLIFPEESIIFTTKKLESKTYNINLDNYVTNIKDVKLANYTSLLDKLYEKAIESLFISKTLHDKLEEYYIAAMDFEKVDEFTKEFINNI